MNGPQHYREAERLRECAKDATDSLEWAAYFNAAAQVHATLALAAATAYPAVKEWLGDESRASGRWAEVAE